MTGVVPEGERRFGPRAALTAAVRRTGPVPDGLPGLADVLDASSSCAVLVGEDGTVAFANLAFAHLVGQDPERMQGRPVADLLPAEVAAASDAGSRHGSGPRGGALRPKVPVTDQVWTDALGGRRRIAWTITTVTDPLGGPGHLLATGVDMTRERGIEATWRARAHTDPLTGLPNRAAVLDVLISWLHPGRGAGCGLLYCDLDGFKPVNDMHGHGVGDLVLQEAARRFTAAVRPDDIVGRLGGDEFVVLLAGAGSIGMRAVAPRVERVFARPVRIADARISVGVSVGIRVADPGEDPAVVLHDADTAMYAAKHARQRSRALLPAAAASSPG